MSDTRDALAFDITSMGVFTTPMRFASGDSIFARFTLEIGPLLITGCSLALPAEGGLRVWLPRTNNSRVILRGPIRLELLKAALKAYRAACDNYAGSPLATALAETSVQ